LLAEQRIVVDLGDAKDRKPQRLAGDGAPVRAAAANLAVPLDDGDRFALFHRLHGGPFAAGAGANYDDVEFLVRNGGHGGSTTSPKRKRGSAGVPRLRFGLVCLFLRGRWRPV